VRLHERVAGSPAALVAATLEDALRVEERPNVPGTVAPARQNWSLALPSPLEELAGDPRVSALAGAMRR
jgi:4-alpha-glucanotransferase